MPHVTKYSVPKQINYNMKCCLLQHYCLLSVGKIAYRKRYQGLTVQACGLKQYQGVGWHFNM